MDVYTLYRYIQYIYRVTQLSVHISIVYNYTYN
jgi:hypothetical protein